MASPIELIAVVTITISGGYNYIVIPFKKVLINIKAPL